VALIVCDTDVLIDALRGRGEHDRFSGEYRRRRLATTAISIFELLSGAREEKERAKVDALLAPLARFAFDERAARAAAAVKLELEAEGRAVAFADLQIAGICLALEAPLWTRNRAHFERVPGLELF
jgi:tRNA(fMet)-specific endonuclease VapC